jgi:hypothetical protein
MELFSIEDFFPLVVVALSVFVPMSLLPLPLLDPVDFSVNHPCPLWI